MLKIPRGRLEMKAMRVQAPTTSVMIMTNTLKCHTAAAAFGVVVAAAAVAAAAAAALL
jgi:hypothetical protein